MTCYVHPDRDVVGTCVHCGKFICAECATEIQGKYYCKRCVNEVFSQQKQDLDKAKDQSAQSPMVFMNSGGASSSSASAAAASSGGGYRGAVPPYPRNSVLIHILLFLFTCGIGNLIYFIYIKSQQNKWTAMYANR